MNRIDGVLFDLDGTILNTNELVIRAFQFTLKKHLELNIPREEISSFFGETLTETLNRYASNPDQLKDMLETFQTYDLANHDNFARFFPQMPELIKNLADNGLKIAIVTSKQRYMTSRCFHLPEIETYIQTIITYDDVSIPKPNPEPLLIALQRLRIKPSNAIMVGDSPADIQSAKRAGTYSAALAWSVFKKAVLMKEHPDFYIETPQKLEEIILRSRSVNLD